MESTTQQGIRCATLDHPGRFAAVIIGDLQMDPVWGSPTQRAQLGQQHRTVRVKFGAEGVMGDGLHTDAYPQPGSKQSCCGGFKPKKLIS